MEKILQEILSEVKSIHVKVGGLEEGQRSLEEGQRSLEEGQQRIEKKLDAVYEQTAELTEFRTETRQSLSEMKDCIHFLMHKEVQTEKEIFLLKERGCKEMY